MKVLFVPMITSQFHLKKQVVVMASNNLQPCPCKQAIDSKKSIPELKLYPRRYYCTVAAAVYDGVWYVGNRNLLEADIQTGIGKIRTYLAAP